MEAGGNSKGWISGGTVEGRGRECWRAHPRKPSFSGDGLQWGLGKERKPRN